MMVVMKFFSSFFAFVGALAAPFLTFAHDSADIIIFSYNRPLQLFACLESIAKFVTDSDHISVIYRASSEQYEDAYTIVKGSFPGVFFARQPNHDIKASFKPLVLKLAFDKNFSNNDYLVFCTDDILVKDYIQLSEGVDLLKKTKSYGLFYRLGKNVTYCYMNNEPHKMPRFRSITNTVVQWVFSDSSGDFNYPNSVDFTLYNKKTIEADLRQISYEAPNKMEEKWAARAQHYKMGLCYTTSKIVNLPLNIVSEYNYPNRQSHYLTAAELLSFFERGLKMDIGPLYQYNNKSAHMDYFPTFVLRNSN